MTDDRLIGSNLGKYHIESELGRGGMGNVYLANDPMLERQVAIKVLAHHLAGDKDFIDRFLREARSAARLRHPNIVTIHDVGQQGDWYYFVMEYLSGQTLAVYLKHWSEQHSVTDLSSPCWPGLSTQEGISILRPLAAALDYAHRQGIIHRDVKPSNVVLSPERHVTLMDFGIARAVQSGSVTRTGAVIGTPEYMSPEQAKGEKVSTLSDQFSLAVMAYQMFTGCVPFQADSALGAMYRLVHDPPPPLSDQRPDLPPEVDSVLRRGMAKTPQERYPSVGAFVEALDSAVIGETSGESTVSASTLFPDPATQIVDTAGTARPTGQAENVVTGPGIGLKGTLVVPKEETSRPPVVPPPVTPGEVTKRPFPLWILGVGGLILVLLLAGLVAGLVIPGLSGEENTQREAEASPGVAALADVTRTSTSTPTETPEPTMTGTSTASVTPAAIDTPTTAPNPETPEAGSFTSTTQNTPSSLIEDRWQDLPPAPPVVAVENGALYDDFNDPAYDGSYAPSHWIEWASAPNVVAQQDGVLVLAQSDKVETTALAARQYDYITIDAPTFFEASLLLDPDKRAGDVHLQLYAELPGNAWFSKCVIEPDGDRARAICRASEVGAAQDEYQTQSVSVELGTWHVFRIQIDPVTMTFSYVIDGQPVGSYVPALAETLREGAAFTAAIGIWTDSLDPLIGYVDNVLIGEVERKVSRTTPIPAPTETPSPIPATFTPTQVAATPVVTEPSPTTQPDAAPTPAAGQFVLLQPVAPGQEGYVASTGPTTFEWLYDGALGPDQGFEIRVWRDGEIPAGAHNAVEDNQQGRVIAVGGNTYRLDIDISGAQGVNGRSGEYLWTVLLVQISPEYKELGVQATPGGLRFEAPGGGGGDDGGGGGSSPTF